MKFSDFICKDAIRTHLEADKKESVIRAMVTSLMEAKKIDKKDFESIVEAILKREELGSTGIGDGIAIPHGKFRDLEDLMISFGRSRKGIDFSATDGKPVHLFFLMVAPENSAGQHLKVLARISRLLKDEAVRRKLMAAKSATELYDVIRGKDEAI